MLSRIGCNPVSNQKGATAVEFAVIASILFVILFGIIEFGFIFMQEHFVANAAREGIRIGVRANNYQTSSFPYSTSSFPGETACSTTTDRSVKIDCEIRNYLQTLYDRDNPEIEVVRVTDKPELQVSVSVDNFFPQILRGLIRILPGTGDFAAPDKMAFMVTGEYEDRDEWAAEEP